MHRIGPRLEQKSRAIIFIGPALVFIFAGAGHPAVQTFYLSFLDENTEYVVWLDNYQAVLRRPGVQPLDNWTNLFTSQLFYIALGMLAVGIIVGSCRQAARTGHRDRQPEASSSRSQVGFFLCLRRADHRSAARSSTTSGGCSPWCSRRPPSASAFAVLADRSKGENVAKSLIFLPMAISFVGAGMIWRFMYIARPPGDEQTGVMNALWVWLGRQQHRHRLKTIVVVVLAHRSRPRPGAASVGRCKDKRQVRSPGVAAGPAAADSSSTGSSDPGSAGSSSPRTASHTRPRSSSSRIAVQQRVADGDPDLDPDRLRHGHPVGGDQGGARRDHRGGARSTGRRRRRSSGG